MVVQKMRTYRGVPVETCFDEKIVVLLRAAVVGADLLTRLGWRQQGDSLRVAARDLLMEWAVSKNVAVVP